MQKLLYSIIIGIALLCLWDDLHTWIYYVHNANQNHVAQQLLIFGNAIIQGTERVKS